MASMASRKERMKVELKVGLHWPQLHAAKKGLPEAAAQQSPALRRTRRISAGGRRGRVACASHALRAAATAFARRWWTQFSLAVQRVNVDNLLPDRWLGPSCSSSHVV